MLKHRYINIRTNGKKKTVTNDKAPKNGCFVIDLAIAKTSKNNMDWETLIIE